VSNTTVIRIIDGQPTLETIRLDDEGDGVRVKVAAASICGSDLHMVSLGMAEGRVLGHEFAGLTPDGTAVTIEPFLTCGSCVQCLDGELVHCESNSQFIGIHVDGGMATEVIVPARTLVPLPSGLDVTLASMVEPLAVALHGANRASIIDTDVVLVIGAGSVGLAAAAVLRDRGCRFDVVARHPHQQAAAQQLGARNVVRDAGELTGGYDVVVDAVGSTETVAAAVDQLAPRGRLSMLGVFWEPVSISNEMLMKEVTFIPAMTYRGSSAHATSGSTDSREFVHAARILAERPDVADIVVTHRFPLDGAAEAFETAGDRRSGAIKVAFVP
jgi:2-desacetyl-2-hydroxyethyl bacteriochlorophyllide A dehydrogenase